MKIHRVTRGYGGLQGVARGYRGYKGLKGVTGGYKRLQGVTRTCFLTRLSTDSFPSSICIKIKVEEISNF